MDIKEFEQLLNTEESRFELAKSWATYMMEDKGVADTFSDDSYYGMIKDYLPKSFQLYNKDIRDCAVVMNVKQKGSPDWEFVEKELGSEIEHTICDSIWNNEISIFGDILDNDIFPNEDIAIVGRSGGYWGFHLDDFDYYSLLEWDGDKLVSLLNTLLVEKKVVIMKIVYEELYDYDKGTAVDIPDSDFYFELTNLFNNLDFDIENYIKLSDKWAKKLKEFEETMNAQIETFETTDYWVTLLRDNPSFLSK